MRRGLLLIVMCLLLSGGALADGDVHILDIISILGKKDTVAIEQHAAEKSVGLDVSFLFLAINSKDYKGELAEYEKELYSTYAANPDGIMIVYDEGAAEVWARQFGELYKLNRDHLQEG